MSTQQEAQIKATALLHAKLETMPSNEIIGLIFHLINTAEPNDTTDVLIGIMKNHLFSALIREGHL